MKKLLYLSMAFVAILGFTACGDDSSDNNNQQQKEEEHYDPKTYEQKVEFAAAAADSTIEIKNMKGAITVQTYTREWVDVTVVAGTQSVKVTADANNTYRERTVKFTINDEKKNAVILTVKQAAKEQSTDVDEDNLNNEVSDWPSLSREVK